MADYLTLEEAKSHLRVDFDDDDTYITALLDVVENVVETELEANLSDLEEGGILPRRLQQGMLILLTHFYVVREAVEMGHTVNKIPWGMEWLFSPYKNWTIR